MVTNNIAFNAQLEAFQDTCRRAGWTCWRRFLQCIEQPLQRSGPEHFDLHRNTGAWGLMRTGWPIGARPGGPVPTEGGVAAVQPDGPRWIRHVLDMDGAEVARALDQEHGWVNYLTHWNAPWYLRQVRLQRIRLRDPQL